MVVSNKIQLTNKDGSHLTYLDNFSDCLLSEQINGSYMTSFVAYVDDKLKYIAYENLVVVEGQKFEVARITKKRADYPNVLVECDHVSYKLNKVMNEFGYDDTPLSIISQLLGLAAAKNIFFTIGRIDFSTPIYFKPGEKSIRECIIELAGVLGGEIIWDNYTINIVAARGSDKGLEFVVGQNIREFSHEVDYTDEEPFTAIEIDIVDLSQLPDFEERYKEIQSINLGDSVKLKDAVLAIDEKQRVVSYDRDPFEKSLPKISIGNVPRLFTDYGEREKDDDDNDETTVYFKGTGALFVGPIGDEVKTDPVIYSFKVGSQQILDVVDSEFTEEYMYETGIFHPDIFVEIKIVRTVIRLSEYTLRTYNVLVRNGENSYIGMDFKGDTLTIIGEYPNDIELYIFDGEMIPENIIKAYGASVILEENNDADDEYREWMTKLTIAGENVLAFEGLNKTHQAQEGQIKSPPIVNVSSEWGDFVLEVPQDKMRDYFIRVSAMNLINGRSIRTYNKNGFSGNQFIGAGWGPFAKDRETARYVIQFRTNNGQDGAGIVRAFSFNATLTLPEDLEEWPGSEPEVAGQDGYFLEFGKSALADTMTFEFKYEEGYDEIWSVTTGINGDASITDPLTIVTSPIYTGDKITAIKGVCDTTAIDTAGYEVSIQAMCKIVEVVE